MPLLSTDLLRHPLGRVHSCPCTHLPQRRLDTRPEPTSLKIRSHECAGATAYIVSRRTVAPLHSTVPLRRSAMRVLLRTHTHGSATERWDGRAQAAATDRLTAPRRRVAAFHPGWSCAKVSVRYHARRIGDNKECCRTNSKKRTLGRVGALGVFDGTPLALRYGALRVTPWLQAYKWRAFPGPARAPGTRGGHVHKTRKRISQPVLYPGPTLF